MEAPREPQFLTKWGLEGERSRIRTAGIASVLAHLTAIVLVLSVPRIGSTPNQIPQHHRMTPLIAPPSELTQTAPNKSKLSKEITAESSIPRPRIHIPRATRPPAMRAAAAPPPATPALPEPPKMDAAAQTAKAPPETELPPPPQIQPQESPKLAFENPAPAPGTPRNPGLGKLAASNSSVSEAVRSLARGNSQGGLVVGDGGGIGEGLNLPPAPGKVGSNLELLSDPLGVDFRPYLIQILGMVRRNWFAVMPESVKLGQRGKVAIQFSINRQGAVPRLVIAMPSGSDPLDRAAVAGISASVPFPPLPSEFHGLQVKLQFTFSYNVPGR